MKYFNNIFEQLFIIIFANIIICCSTKDNTSEVKDLKINENTDLNNARFMNEILDSCERVKAEKKVKLYGDTNSYNNLRVLYLDYPTKYFIPYTLIMADKFNYKPAYYDVYFYIGIKYHQQKEWLSKKGVNIDDYNMAINHLVKGSELGNPKCIEIIDKYYPELKK